MVNECFVVIRGLVSEEQAKNFKKKKEYVGMILEVYPDNLNRYRYMLVRIDGFPVPSKFYPGEWDLDGPTGVELQDFFEGKIWDYCQWDNNGNKKILTFFKENKPFVQYFKDKKQFIHV